MHLRRRIPQVLFVASALLALTVGAASAQSVSSPGISGGTSLVVSRASVPAPSVSTAPSLVSVLAASWRWNMVALASARGWAWSFAPALGASYARPVAVRRRAA